MHKDKKARVITSTGPAGKAAVIGLLERHGLDGKTSRVRAGVLGSIRRRTLHGAIHATCEPGSEIFTDDLDSYKKLDEQFIHKVIDHAECYAKGKVHTNGLENFWSLLKRGIKGTYVAVEPFHLFRYLDEQVFRSITAGPRMSHDSLMQWAASLVNVLPTRPLLAAICCRVGRDAASKPKLRRGSKKKR